MGLGLRFKAFAFRVSGFGYGSLSFGAEPNLMAALRGELRQHLLSRVYGLGFRGKGLGFRGSV